VDPTLEVSLTCRTLTPALALVLLLTQGVGASPSAAATTYHVSKTGSDANPGTKSKPFRTIKRAVNAAAPGDSLLVHAGTYAEVIQIWNSGTSTKRIVLTSAGDGKVIVTATFSKPSCHESTPTRDRTIQILGGADHWTIRRLTIVNGVLISGDNIPRITDARVRDRTLPGRGSYDPVAAAKLLELLSVNGADHNWIIDNKITGRGVFTTAARHGLIADNEVYDVDCGTGAGIWVNAFSDFNNVSDNYVHDIPASEHHYMSEGIRQGRGSSYNLVENNLVEDLGGEGRGLAVDTYAGWNTIRHNTARRADQGLNEQSAGWGNQWLNNRSEKNRRYGFNIDGKDGALERPDDGVPAKMVVRCTVASGNGKEDLHIGAVQQSEFSTNAFSEAWVSPRAAGYWGREGNTWNGQSKPPGATPPKKFCA
jgi:hypothetical protein